MNGRSAIEYHTIVPSVVFVNTVRSRCCLNKISNSCSKSFFTIKDRLKMSHLEFATLRISALGVFETRTRQSPFISRILYSH